MYFLRFADKTMGNCLKQSITPFVETSNQYESVDICKIRLNFMNGTFKNQNR